MIKKLIEKEIKHKIKFDLNNNLFSPINNLNDRSIFFSDSIDRMIRKKINMINYGILITKKKDSRIKKTILQVINTNPKLFFFELIKKIPFEKKTKKKKIKIGKGSKISKNVTIGNNVIIGNNCTIHSGVVIANNVEIGNNCNIKSNSVIGQRGFGVLKNIENNLIEIPHIGNVKIKDNVEIGALNTIARGTLGSTVIDSYNKLDDHVHIAHNCFIKKNNIICAGVIFGGSVTVEENNFFGLNSTIKNKISIGKNNIIGQSSNLVKNIGDNRIVFGNPAK